MTWLIGVPSRSASAMVFSLRTIASAASRTESMSLAATESHRRTIGNDVVSSRNRDFSNRDRLVRRDLHDTTACGVRRMASGENREVQFAAVVDVPRRAFDDDSGNTAQFGAKRQRAAPRRRVQPGALLDDNDVAGLCRFNSRRAKVTLGSGPAFRLVQLDRQHPARDAAIRG